MGPLPESRLDGGSSSHLDPRLSAETRDIIGKKRSSDCLRDSPEKHARVLGPDERDAAEDRTHRPKPTHSIQPNNGPIDPPVAENNELVSAWLSSLGSDAGSPECERPTEDQVVDSKRDADGFVIPSTPSRSSIRPNADTISDVSGSARSTKSLVEDPLYRTYNLQLNRIHLRSTAREYPETIASLVRCVEQDRASPGPSVEQLVNDASLEQLENGAMESTVVQYFSGDIFPSPGFRDVLQRTDRQPMSRQSVPRVAGAMYNVSNPVPDMLYGYGIQVGFAELVPQLSTLGNQPSANTEQLTYPFLVVEFKGEGGSLWVATNQCLGAASACVNMIEQLHQKCEAYHVDGIDAYDRAVFSVAISGTEARIYVSWLDDSNGQDYYTQKIRSFCLQEPDQHIVFRRHVRNIVDWGKGRHLDAIKAALVRLTDSDEYKAAAVAAPTRSCSGSRSRSDSVGSDSASAASGGKRQRV